MGSLKLRTILGRMGAVSALCAVFLLPSLGQEAADSDYKWWMSEPIRLVQTNLRKTDDVLDPARLAEQLDAMNANTVLFGMGGIVAHFRTETDFHYPSEYMPEGADLFGDMLREAKARNMRVIGRFDFSKTQPAVYEAHPEWFFRRANGQPVFYNGLYSACINGDYYQDHIFKILAEALERYAVDGLFFNMFGNPSRDYSGDSLGLCHCDACQRKFRAKYNRDIPDQPDAEYRQFMFESSRGVARRIGDLIHEKRPQAAFLTYIQEYVDGIMSESNTAVDRALPMWLYSASDRVSRAHGSQPGKMAFNLSIGFVDIPYRMATVPKPEIKIRLFENMAYGSGPMFVALGTLDQEDKAGLAAASEVFARHAANEELYVGQHNAARVMLLGDGREASYRGFFRLLSEQHIPFTVSDNMDWLAAGANAFDVVITNGEVAPELDRFVREGGHLLVAGARHPGLGLPEAVRRWSNTRSAYVRIHDHQLFPSLAETNVAFLDGEYLELPSSVESALTLIPPAMFGPPELVWSDKEETSKPALVVQSYGDGEFAYVPWDIGGLYYRHSSTAHSGMMADLIDHLLPQGRQLRTSAHPLVEMTLMEQPEHDRTLLHLINLSGHSQTGYFDPIPMEGIEVELVGDFDKAHARTLGRDIPVRFAEGVTHLTLPRLDDYEVIVLE